MSSAIKSSKNTGPTCPSTEISESVPDLWPTIRATDGERGGRGDLIQSVRGNPNEHYSRQSILFAGDSLASPSVRPGSDSARKTTAISGRKWLVLSKNSGPLGCLERMLLGSSRWNSTARFLTWKTSATPAGRLLFRLVPSRPATNASEYLLLPTPRASDGNGGGAINRPRGPYAYNLKDWWKWATGHWRLAVGFSERLMGFPENWTEVD